MKIEDRGIGGVFLERAAAEELEQTLSADGWQVEREVKIDGGQFDLVAQRGAETVFYEFKLAGSPSPADWASQLVSYQKLARERGASFRLVLVRPPRQMELEVEGIEHMLFAALAEAPPWQIADIAGHTLIDEVEGVDLTAIRISGVTAVVEGEANIGVTLQTGGGEVIGSETFPFSFTATINLAEGSVDEVEVHDVDTSSWYGDDTGADGDGDSPDSNAPDDDLPF